MRFDFYTIYTTENWILFNFLNFQKLLLYDCLCLWILSFEGTLCVDGVLYIFVIEILWYEAPLIDRSLDLLLWLDLQPLVRF